MLADFLISNREGTNKMMRNLSKASVLATTLLSLCGIASAAPSIQGVRFTIDKPSYNSTYSVGAAVSVDGSGTDIASVSVTHQPLTSDSLGTWQLAETSSGSWWSWAYSWPRPQISSGPLDGTITVTVTDVNGQTTTRNDISFQPLAELPLPIFDIQLTTDGYQIHTTNVAGADYYDLWLWDPVERFYPSTQRVTNVNNFQTIPFEGLVDGRDYDLSLIANNYVSGGSVDNPYGLLYRSYTLERLTYSAAAVPEPETYAMLLAGLGLVGFVARRRRQVEN